MRSPSRSAETTIDRYRTRPSLLDRIAKSDDAGWADFYHTYAPIIRWRCRSRGEPSVEVADLVVQAVMRHFALTKWSYDREIGRFRNLLIRVADLKLHEVRRELRPVRQIPPSYSTFPPNLDEEEDGSSTEEAAEQLIQLRRALERLFASPDGSTRDLQILEMAMDGKANGHIATHFGLTVGHIRLIKHRMLVRLREEIGRINRQA